MLTTRIAFVRTWTYLVHQKGWIDDAERWQARTRAVEDRLSDALHTKLTQRFVDRRPTRSVGRRAGSAPPPCPRTPGPRPRPTAPSPPCSTCPSRARRPSG